MESGSCIWREIRHISGWLFRGRGSLAMVRRIDYDGTNGLMKTALLAGKFLDYHVPLVETVNKFIENSQWKF